MSLVDRQKERRKLRRFPSAELRVQLRIKKTLKTVWEDIDASDFNVGGMAILHKSEPELDQSVTLRLLLEMDMGQIRVDRIEARIKNKVKTLQGWRIGVQFDENQIGKDQELKAQLERISRILEKSTSVNRKLKSQ